MKTIVIMGNSGVGKDCTIQYLSHKYHIPIALSTTTRPMREGEQQGREYNFVTKEEFDKYEYPIPPRVYHTVHGDWYYGTDRNVGEGKIIILDYSGTKSLCDYLGREKVSVIKLNTKVSILLERIKNRGDNDSEMKRRLIDDIEQFMGSDEYADYVVENNGIINELYQKLDWIMHKILY